MDNNVEEYLTSTSHTVSDQLLSEDESVEIYYERRISAYRSSTVMVQEAWGDSHIIYGEEMHYEEFL